MHREGMTGAIVEFGVSEGRGLGQLRRFRDKLGMRNAMYGFDSFAGLPEPGEHDPACWSAGEFAHPLAAATARANPNNDPTVHLVEGWFADTLPKTETGPMAYARIDCDLYQSAVESLAYLEHRLVDGAFLIFDDWTDDPTTGETRAFFEFAAGTEKLRFEVIHRISLGGMHLRVHHTRENCVPEAGSPRPSL